MLGGFAWRSIGMNFESSHLENLFVALCEPHFSYIGWNLTQYWIFALFNSLFHRIQILLKISLIRFWFSTFSHHIWKDQGNDETDSHDNDNNDQTDWDDNDFHDFSISFYKLAKKAADIMKWSDLRRGDVCIFCFCTIVVLFAFLSVGFPDVEGHRHGWLIKVDQQAPHVP